MASPGEKILNANIQLQISRGDILDIFRMLFPESIRQLTDQFLVGKRMKFDPIPLRNHRECTHLFPMPFPFLAENIIPEIEETESIQAELPIQPQYVLYELRWVQMPEIFVVGGNPFSKEAEAWEVFPDIILLEIFWREPAMLASTVGF